MSKNEFVDIQELPEDESDFHFNMVDFVSRDRRMNKQFHFEQRQQNQIPEQGIDEMNTVNANHGTE